jgi:hypothetical protein
MTPRATTEVHLDLEQGIERALASGADDLELHHDGTAIWTGAPRQ